ncbi:hypothetical protein F8388_024167 [Cannabis sativa]|uniref:Uncharacterized protein n=1 Tax=Cannabis sativa TaxID=3483 RepID=A0A7J6FXT9_CANSA|nr:hypothetical protein F8388_024167 [Cannabis sativa]
MSSVVKSLEPLSGLTRDLSVPFVYVVPTELGREEKVDHDDEEVVLMSSRTDDYCPSLKLEESDFVMPRKNFPLWRLIANDPFLIKAKIHEWSDGEEFQKTSTTRLPKRPTRTQAQSQVRTPQQQADDYCPSLKLEESDFVMPRKNFLLWRLIANDPLLINAKIHEWSDGEEFQKVLLKLINTISTGDHEIESVFTAPPSNSKYQILPLMSFPTGQTLCDIDHQILDQYHLD